jgi:hypothetical protein
MASPTARTIRYPVRCIRMPSDVRTRTRVIGLRCIVRNTVFAVCVPMDRSSVLPARCNGARTFVQPRCCRRSCRRSHRTSKRCGRDGQHRSRTHCFRNVFPGGDDAALFGWRAGRVVGTRDGDDVDSRIMCSLGGR